MLHSRYRLPFKFSSGAASAVLLILLLLGRPAAAQDSAQGSAQGSASDAPINYCAGTLSYDLPDGWVESAIQRTQYGAAVRLANSAQAIGSQTLADGDAVIVVNVIGRDLLTHALHIDAHSDIVTLLNGVGAQTAGTSFSPLAVAPILMDGQLAARMDVHNAALDMTVFAIELDANAVGLIALSTPSNQVSQQQATALDFARSLAYSAPAFPASSMLTAAAYASDDCKVAFSYPQDWTLQSMTQAPGQFYQVQVRNFDASTAGSSAYALTSGQVRIEIGVVMPAPADYSDSLDALAEQISQKQGYDIVSRDETTIAGQPAVLIQIHVDDPAEGLAGETLQISMHYGNDALVALALFTAPGELDQWRDTALAIAESLSLDVPSAAQ